MGAPATISSGDIEALVSARHADPFAVLGPHAVSPGVTVVRALCPGASRLDLLTLVDGVVHDMRRLHRDGLFETTLESDGVPDYRLRCTGGAGRVYEFDDPYRYGPMFGEIDAHLFAEGTHRRAADALGARVVSLGGTPGVHFAVWAPNASHVSVVGDFNGWDARVHPMRFVAGAGVWEIFLPALGAGPRYKFEITDRRGRVFQKADPFGRWFETPPDTASVVWHDTYAWRDAAWVAQRAATALAAPMSVYEVHLGSWRRFGHGERVMTYREMAASLVPYVKDLGFTHIELLPVMEHPYTGSWGYQVIGFFAPTSRFGTPEDFKFFVDACHQAGLGVLLDWVPGHFPKDAHGLARFDGTALYEHADPRQGEHQDWGTLVFNYGRHEVRSFLLSSALHWLREFHIDGLRVDAVASMLYLDYSREEGEWVPNAHGGRENLVAIDFLRELNVAVHQQCPGILMIAEESTSWPQVSRPTYLGGLGFDLKWNMGWMNDTLRYMAHQPVHRQYHHGMLTFSMLYCFTENFMLPFSHDEVVHGKGSMLHRMPGDEWQKHANLRALYAYQFTHPGKKLLFMGTEFGQGREWDSTGILDWYVLEYPLHQGMQRLVRDLNRLYRAEPALHRHEFDWQGFEWIDCNDAQQSVISYLRKGNDGEQLAVVLNLTPVPRRDYRIGVPCGGRYREVLNTDAAVYGGSDVGNGAGLLEAEEKPWMARAYSLVLTLPPLAAIVLAPAG